MTSKLSVAPSARRLTHSLRDVGYSFESAVADLVDNSITANAKCVEIEIVFAGKDSTVVIADDGDGMDATRINESMRFGSRSKYGNGDLGRYGLGLKTASLSQCKRIEVFSRQLGGAIEARALDLDFIDAVDDWLITDISPDPHEEDFNPARLQTRGTVVVWKKLDRILPVKAPEGGWARRRFERLPERLSEYLSMVFHRFLAGENSKQLVIKVNGTQLTPWDPFAREEAQTKAFPADEFEIDRDHGSGRVRLKRYLLPTRDQFSSPEAYERYSGPDRWNKQQGLYIYRADRLVQWGGWAGVRTSDEHTKFARVSLDFGTDLDSAFNINVAKMRVNIPGELRKMITRPINEVCMLADSEYRRSANRKSDLPDKEGESEWTLDSSSETGATVGLSLRAAAARSGHMEALTTIMELLSDETPEIARYLGFKK
ncbi:ATP-binding protein [Corynebacterium sanguinis]